MPTWRISATGRPATTWCSAEKLRFFDRYVRGIRNGFEREPPVLIYVMGKGWRREDEWPLRRARRLAMSLDTAWHAGRRPAQPEDG